eukprot:7098256-Prymnesium_polylepis.1
MDNTLSRLSCLRAHQPPASPRHPYHRGLPAREEKHLGLHTLSGRRRCWGRRVTHHHGQPSTAPPAPFPRAPAGRPAAPASGGAHNGPHQLHLGVGLRIELLDAQVDLWRQATQRVWHAPPLACRVCRRGEECARESRRCASREHVHVRPVGGRKVGRPQRCVAGGELLHAVVEVSPDGALAIVVVNVHALRLPQEVLRLRPQRAARLEHHQRGAQLAARVALVAKDKRRSGAGAERREVVDVAQHDDVIVEDDEALKLGESEGTHFGERRHGPLRRPCGHADRRRVRQHADAEGREPRLCLCKALAGHEHSDRQG